MEASKILVVANAYEAERMIRWLRAAGYPHVLAGDGGDDTLAEFHADPADVVVLSAALEAGDSLALAGALRAEKPGVPLILIGDERGHVRNALDAIEYRADRFLRGPVAEKALLFCVKSSLDAAKVSIGGLAGNIGGPSPTPELTSSLSDITKAPAPVHRRAETSAGVAAVALSARMEAVTTEMLSAFWNDSLSHMLAVAPDVDAPAGETEPARAVEMEADAELDDLSDAVEMEADEAADAEAEFATPTSTGQFSGFPDAPPAAPAPQAPLAAVSGEIVVPNGASRSATKVAAADEIAIADLAGSQVPPPPADESPLPVIPAAEPEPSQPHWREPTQILSAGSRAPASAASAEPADAPPANGAPSASAIDVSRERSERRIDPDREARAAALELAGSPGGDETRTGTFAKELRRTMSAIEQRLFGGAPDAAGDAAREDAEDAGGEGEIDLDKIGVDTLPGLAPDDARVRRAPPSAVTSVDGRERDGDVDEGDDDDEIDARGSTHVRTRDPAIPAQRGDLRDEDAAMLLARLHREAFSGKVVFRRGDAEKSISFAEGRPVFATSNLPHDRMGDLLYREGKITREQHAKSREIVAETGRRMGEILVDMGFLKRRELLPAVRRHIEDVIYSLFGWDAGGFVAQPSGRADAAQGEKIRLATHPTALVVEGIRRKMGLDRLRDRLGGPSSVIVPLKRDEIAGGLAEADLSTDERQAADLFDGRRTLADVTKHGKLDETSVYQLAFALLALGLARALEHRDSDSARVTGVSPSGTPSLAGAADVAIDRERVLAKHAHVSEADYFAVLGVRRDASAFEIRRAYEAARRDYAAESFAVEVQRELAEPLREIAVVLDEAFRVLRDDRVRTQYLSNLRE